MKPDFVKLKEIIMNEKKIFNELESSFSSLSGRRGSERKIIMSHINSLTKSLKDENKNIIPFVENISIAKPLIPKTSNEVEMRDNLPNKKEIPKIKKKGVFESLFGKSFEKEIGISSLEKETLKRVKKKKAVKAKKKIKKPNKYVLFANRFFFKFSSSVSKSEIFRGLERDLIKANLQFIPASYISTLFFTTLLSFFVSLFILLFFIFFNFGAEWPIITRAAVDPISRLLKIFWIPFAIPLVTFAFGYFYPSMEKKALENQINQELPFAAIHMFAISGSLIDPSKIFSVLISTKEYVAIEKEFIKLINEIAIYGYDLVNALKSTALNTPSKKLAELLNGFATTITSGGDLREFFDKRSETLLFDYRLEREKYTKSAETFMDIYISVVIAAPMILMLLVILIKISGLGIALSTSVITLIMILGVSMINVLFLTFLYLKQPST
ncbi:MAG: type II secretion system F family protein [Candidatus Pacearchaeota archaeon]|jgi:Flp pilus assembly protein TadB